MKVKARLAASIGLALGVALGATGCTLLVPQETTKIQEASDGVSGSVGSVDVRDALLITNGNGTTGNLVVTLVNNSGSEQQLELQHGSTTETVAVPAYGLKKLGSDAKSRVQFTKLDAKPGGIADVYFSSDSATGVKLQVPVLSESFPGFGSYGPRTPKPTMTGFPTSTPGETTTPAPTSTATNG